MGEEVNRGDSVFKFNASTQITSDLNIELEAYRDKVRMKIERRQRHKDSLRPSQSISIELFAADAQHLVQALEMMADRACAFDAEVADAEDRDEAF